jgi:hypothetical protein
MAKRIKKKIVVAPSKAEVGEVMQLDVFVPYHEILQQAASENSIND